MSSEVSSLTKSQNLIQRKIFLMDQNLKISNHTSCKSWGHTTTLLQADLKAEIFVN